jgi:hypothetical protein
MLSLSTLTDVISVLLPYLGTYDNECPRRKEPKP